MKTLITETLKYIGCYSEDAVNLLLGTMAQESAFGKYRRQLGNGPALGVFQMEPRTHDDIVKNFLSYHKDLGKKILEISGLAQFSPMQLEGNDRYAISMARMQYWRFPDRMPHDIQGYAMLWKSRYNTPLGAGTVEEYVKNYHKYVLNS